MVLVVLMEDAATEVKRQIEDIERFVQVRCLFLNRTECRGTVSSEKRDAVLRTDEKLDSLANVNEPVGQPSRYSCGESIFPITSAVPIAGRFASPIFLVSRILYTLLPCDS